MANVTVRAWQLGRALANLREQTCPRLTQKEAGDLIECSQSKIAQVEAGKLKITKTELNYLLRAYNADQADMDQLEQLRVEIANGERGWWSGLPGPVGTFVGLEQAAKRVRTVELVLIPGLLQTEEYARDLHALSGELTAEEIDAKVATRMQRQTRLTAAVNPLELSALISYSALTWCMEEGDTIGAAQLRRLYERAQLPNVDVRIMAPSRGRHSGMQGAYNLLSFPSEVIPEVAWYEQALGGRVTDDEAAIATLARLFTKIRNSQALGCDESLALLADLASNTH